MHINNARLSFLKHDFLALGLQPIQIDACFDYDDLFDLYKTQKKRLYKHYEEKVCSSIADSNKEQLALAKFVKQNTTNKDANSSVDLPSNRPCPKIWPTSLLTQEDLCILTKQNNDYVLTAGSVCFPSEWCLSDKLGKSLREIHGPVPSLNAMNGKAIYSFFDKLPYTHAYQRFNWSLKNNSSLSLLTCLSNKSERRDLTENIIKSQHGLYLRVERQCFFRLTKQAIGFSIRIYLYPIEILRGTNDGYKNLSIAIGRLSPDQISYKNMLDEIHTFRRLERELSSNSSL